MCDSKGREKQKTSFHSWQIFHLNIFPAFSRVSSNMSPNSQLEHEKRVRREIANSNERRRMQSINTGFQSLKILIPHSCGEKLSKVCYVCVITIVSPKENKRKASLEKKRTSQGQGAKIYYAHTRKREKRKATFTSMKV